MVRLTLCALLIAAAAGATEPTEYVAKMDELYVTRDTEESEKALDKLISEAVEKQPQSYDVLWRAARFYCWIADSTKSESRKKVTAKQCWSLADRAMALNPKGADAAHWAASGVGLWGEANGVMKSITEGVQGKFNERLDKAIALDSGVDRSGPLIARGRYYYVVPWPLRDLGKSKEFLQKALKANPENLRARVFLADTYLADGDAKKAKEEVTAVLSGDESYDPPGARRAKKLAEITKKSVDEELE